MLMHVKRFIGYLAWIYFNIKLNDFFADIIILITKALLWLFNQSICKTNNSYTTCPTTFCSFSHSIYDKKRYKCVKEFH